MMDSFYIFETVNNVEKGGFDWLGFLGLVVQGLLLYVAFRALNIWKKQLRGTDEYKTAFDLLLIVRKIKDKVGGRIWYLDVDNKIDDENKFMDDIRPIYKFKSDKYDEIVFKSKIVFNDKNLNELLNILNSKIESFLNNYNFILFGDGLRKDIAKEMKKDVLFSQKDKKLYSKELSKIVNDIEIFIKENYINDRSLYSKIKNFLFKK